MRFSYARSALVLLGLIASVALVARASAQQAGHTYAQRVHTASTRLSAGDRGGAAEALREAIQHDPARAEGICLLAEVQRVSGDLFAALDGFNACLRQARAGHDAHWEARALHGIASTLERMPERASDARGAWQDFVTFADAHAALADPQVGRARIAAIDAAGETERVSAEVRARSAERERVATAGAR